MCVSHGGFCGLRITHIHTDHFFDLDLHLERIRALVVCRGNHSMERIPSVPGQVFVTGRYAIPLLPGSLLGAHECGGSAFEPEEEGSVFEGAQVL